MDQIGSRLVEQGIITEKQLELAVKRQKVHGGRLGTNLSALGFIRDEDLNSVFHRTPRPPRSFDETGIEYAQIEGLILKHILLVGEFMLSEMAERVKLPVFLVEQVLDALKKERLIEVTGASSYTSMAYKYRITDLGRDKGNQLMDICRYVGPVPVSLEAYAEMVELQTVKSIAVGEEQVKGALSHLVLSEGKVRSLGPAISSGQALFIYGPPGNGKSAIAEAIGNLLPDTIFIPYAVTVGNQIINVYDPISHLEAKEKDTSVPFDQRWLKVHRPVVSTGGELTLRMLDLDFNPISKYYEAALQMKANNGLLIIDDFGRQQAPPLSILNRWIVPLDRRIDYMTLHTGMKFTIPFDMLLIFATNIEPRELVDEAFLRRIRYKIKIEHPSEEEFSTILQLVCRQQGIKFNKHVFDYLMDEVYRKQGIPLSACHPRDLMEHVLNYSRYYGRPPEMSEETVQFACENYFVKV